MGKSFKRKIQNIVTGAVMSFGKMQETLAQNVNGISNNISIQQEVERQEIKLVKKERFYELFETSSKYQKSIRNMNPEDKRRFLGLSMKTVLTDNERIEIAQEMNELVAKSINENLGEFDEPTGFKNERYGEIMEDVNNLDPNAKHKFETNNDLYKLSYYVKLNKTEIENEIEIDLYVNKNESPSILFTDVNDLSYLKVVEEGKTYLYNITAYLGCLPPKHEDLIYKFKATIEKNGVYDFNMEGEEVVLDKHNMMDKKNINFSSGI